MCRITEPEALQDTVNHPADPKTIYDISPPPFDLRIQHTTSDLESTRRVAEASGFLSPCFEHRCPVILAAIAQDRLYISPPCRFPLLVLVSILSVRELFYPLLLLLV